MYMILSKARKLICVLLLMHRRSEDAKEREGDGEEEENDDVIPSAFELLDKVTGYRGEMGTIQQAHLELSSPGYRADRMTG